MRRGFWYPWIVAGAAMEWLALRNTDHEATLSRLTRWTFRTHHPVGKTLFSAGMVWFYVHIIRPAGEK